MFGLQKYTKDENKRYPYVGYIGKKNDEKQGSFHFKYVDSISISNTDYLPSIDTVENITYIETLSSFDFTGNEYVTINDKQYKIDDINKLFDENAINNGKFKVKLKVRLKLNGQNY